MVISVKPTVLLFYFTMLLIVLTAAFFILTEDESEATASSALAEPMLVIDPGHGGADGGAVSVRGCPESKINLSISLKMSALAELTATPYITTRNSEEIDYPPEASTISKMKVFDQKRRVELIGETPNAVLISVHQNNYPSGKPRGPQSFFGKTAGSPELAALVQESLNSALYPGNRRVATAISERIYLFKNVDCPAVLAECGFLSNREEAELLENDSHQLKVAVAIMSAYFRYTEYAVLST